MKHQLSPARKADILRTFYRSTVGQIFPETFVPSPYAVDQNTGGEWGVEKSSKDFIICSKFRTFSLQFTLFSHVHHCEACMLLFWHNVMWKIVI